LKNAMASVEVKAVGRVIVATVRGPTALHHLGAAAGKITRRVIPSGKLPPRVMRAIVKFVATRFTDG
jgi:hypothetical protein